MNNNKYLDYNTNDTRNIYKNKYLKYKKKYLKLKNQIGGSQIKYEQVKCVQYDKKENTNIDGKNIDLFIGKDITKNILVEQINLQEQKLKNKKNFIQSTDLETQQRAYQSIIESQNVMNEALKTIEEASVVKSAEQIKQERQARQARQEEKTKEQIKQESEEKLKQLQKQLEELKRKK